MRQKEATVVWRFHIEKQWINNETNNSANFFRVKQKQCDINTYIKTRPQTNLAKLLWENAASLSLSIGG
jgi:hypothetical protein